MWQFNVGEDNRRNQEDRANVHAAQLEVQKSSLEYRQLLRQQRIQTYTNVASLAGKIVAVPAGPARKKAIDAFEAYYWGATVMVEDKSVQDAMRDFHDELHDESTGWSRDPNRLKTRAILLASACQNSLKADANVTLDRTP